MSDDSFIALVKKRQNPRRVSTYEELEAALLEEDEGDTNAYDSSHEAPLRELTARERDVLCRVIGIHLRLIQVGQSLDPQEYGRLQLIRHVIDPRRES